MYSIPKKKQKKTRKPIEKIDQKPNKQSLQHLDFLNDFFNFQWFPKIDQKNWWRISQEIDKKIILFDNRVPPKVTRNIKISISKISQLDTKNQVKKNRQKWQILSVFIQTPPLAPPLSI